MAASTEQWPESINTIDQLEEALSRPTPEVGRTLAALKGDILILGVAGKMGPTLAKMARRALDEAGSRARVIGVARFSEPGSRKSLEAAGIETIQADLLDRASLAALPDASNIVFMAGRKFGSSGNESLTWAMNAYVPALVAERYPQSRIVAFSTGNVYPLMTTTSGGPTEKTPVAPVGEYAQSCLGRERMFEYFSAKNGTPIVIIRLNYAIDLRYGVLLDVASKVFKGETIDLTMGHANVIWQGDANAWILRSFDLCASPPAVLNVTGTDIVSVRKLAERFGELFGKPPQFAGTESPTALLNNASQARGLYGQPRVSLGLMMDWIANWVLQGGATLNKPTHFESRDGRF